MYKNVNIISDGFSTHATACRAWSDDIVIIGRRLLHMYITREAELPWHIRAIAYMLSRVKINKTRRRV